MNKPSRNEASGILRQAAMFSQLSGTQIGKLLDRCRWHTHEAGSLIFPPGRTADCFFVILRGRVKLAKISAGGEQQILHLYGPGETFGEAAMWASGTFPASAEAIEDATLISIGRDALRTALAESPDLAMGMLASLSAKLREFNTLIEQLSLKNIPARLAGALLTMATQQDGCSVQLPCTKRELAARLGTAPETLSRALGKLKRARWIDVQGRRIALLDRPALERLSHGG